MSVTAAAIVVRRVQKNNPTSLAWKQEKPYINVRVCAYNNIR